MHESMHFVLLFHYQTDWHGSVWLYITKNKGYLVSEKTLRKHFAHIMFDPCKVCHCLKCSICTDQNFMQKVLVCVFFLFFQKQWVPCFWWYTAIRCSVWYVLPSLPHDFLLSRYLMRRLNLSISSQTYTIK